MYVTGASRSAIVYKSKISFLRGLKNFLQILRGAKILGRVIRGAEKCFILQKNATKWVFGSKNDCHVTPTAVDLA